MTQPSLLMTEIAPHPKALLLDYPVDIVTMAEAVAIGQQAIETQQNLHVVTLNPEMIMQGDSNPQLGQALKQADLNLPDGAGAVWALKRQGYTNLKRLPGIEFSEAMLALANTHGYRVAIVGAKPETHELAIDNLKTRFPQLKVVFHHHGYFESESHAQSIAQACIDSKPQLVLVALGVPKQELWIAEHKPHFEGAVLVGVGGSLDVWSGQTQRAPAFFRTFNLEWLYRITSEPWRLKRVYKTLPLFVLKVLQNNPSA
jgi:N-acetylglucosaminyldiphosphoundecaprenol N-acetyl-beta-D-mannosaminyltransferase